MGPMGWEPAAQASGICSVVCPGKYAPKILGEWHVLLRLEQLTPARFDDQLRLRMQDEALDEFLDARVTRILAGDSAQLEPLHYDRDA